MVVEVAKVVLKRFYQDWMEKLLIRDGCYADLLEMQEKLDGGKYRSVRGVFRRLMEGGDDAAREQATTLFERYSRLDGRVEAMHDLFLTLRRVGVKWDE
jgi:hypothetical protein